MSFFLEISKKATPLRQPLPSDFKERDRDVFLRQIVALRNTETKKDIPGPL
jgi:hypothetical protein